MSFGSWIGMQLLMRRPEVAGFISASAAANLFDFTFLAPCPSSGIVIHGENDRICPPEETRVMVERTRTQKGRRIEFSVLPEADHFMEDHIDAFIETASAYLDKRLADPNPDGPFFE
jgi:alpha/beta superfamily hydrolase